MAVTFNDNIGLKAPKLLDNRSGKIVGGKQVPYDSIAEALNPQTNPKLILDNRAIGLTILVLKDGKSTEYWFKEGIADSDLIEKTTGGVLTQDIVADLTVGGFNAGDIALAGTDLQKFGEKLLTKVFDPTFTSPTYSFNYNVPSLSIIGDVVSGIQTFTYNRGLIYGARESGVWNPNAIQGFRTGAAVSYILAGVPTSQPTRGTDELVVKGLNIFKGRVIYGAGDQPVDSAGEPVGEALSPDTSPEISTSFEGVYPLFATTTTLVTTNIQPLVSMLYGNNVEMVLVNEANGNKQIFEVPQTWLTDRPLQSVQYFNSVSNQFDPTNKLADFTQEVVTKNILDAAVPYVRFTNTSPDRGALKIRLIF